MMTGQQAIRSIDRLLDRSQHRKLNDLESTIVLQIWEGDTYRSIASRCSYDLDYIKQIAAKLWKLLSKLLGEDICKSNIRSVLERDREEIPLANHLPGKIGDLELSTLVAIGSDRDIFPSDRTGIYPQNNEMWTIDDRLTTITFVSSAAISNTPSSIEFDTTPEKINQQQVRDEIQSLIWQNLSEPVNPNILMNEILSVLKVKNPEKSAINCLIINCYF
jgi:hypothetical protein